MNASESQRRGASPAKARAGFVVFAILALSALISADGKCQRAFTVREVRFIGRSAVSGEDAVTAFGLVPGARADSAAIQQGLRRLLDRYHHEGYLRAGVDSVTVAFSSDSSSALLTVALAEGLPAVLRSIAWNGISAARRAAVVGQSELLPGSPFTARALEADIAAVLRAYENDGFVLARAAIGDLGVTVSAIAESVDVAVEVDEGTQIRISEFAVRGNKTTKDAVIMREAQGRLGEVFRPALTDQIRRRLLRLRLFSEVAEPELYLIGHDSAGVLLRVMEGPVNSFDGIVGYVPGARDGDSGYLTGMVHVQLRNLFGSGRAIAVRWYRENASSQEVELRYREPWVASEPVNAEVGLALRQQDSTYVRQHLTFAADVTVGEAFTAGISVSQTNVYPSEGYGKTVMAGNRTFTAGAMLRYDDRDDPLTPMSGAIYETAYALGSKRVSALPSGASERQFTTQRITLDVAAYLTAFARQVLSAELHIRDQRSPQPDPSDLERLGGASTLRGYREGQFAGTRLVWTNLEYRFFFARRSFVFGFGDIGYVALPSAPSAGWTASDQTKAGFGVGLRIDSEIGLIGVSLGFGQGDTFSTAKLHLRLVNEF